MDGMNGILSSLNGIPPLRRLGEAALALLRAAAWGMLLPPVALAVVSIFNGRGLSWGITVVLAGITALLAPAVAADLVAAGLIGLGLYASYITVYLALVFFDLAANPFYSSGSFVGFNPVANYFFTSSVAGGTLDVVKSALILGLGVWLVPRTIGVHSGLVKRNAALASRVTRLAETRGTAVDTAAAELRRIERNLHDGAQARLVTLGINLRAAEQLFKTDPDAALALVAESRQNSALAQAELRDLVRGIHPPVLADRGLAAAVQALALGSPLPAETDIQLPGRPPAPVESAVYFAVAEALTNAVKHSGASRLHIRVAYRAGMLRIEVTDDGHGGADPANGTGLLGVERRVATFDGILAVSSPVPLAGSAPP